MLVYELCVVERSEVIGLVYMQRPGFKIPQVGVNEVRCKSWVTLAT